LNETLYLFLRNYNRFSGFQYNILNTVCQVHFDFFSGGMKTAREWSQSVRNIEQLGVMEPFAYDCSKKGSHPERGRDASFDAWRQAATCSG